MLLSNVKLLKKKRFNMINCGCYVSYIVLRKQENIYLLRLASRFVKAKTKKKDARHIHDNTFQKYVLIKT